MNILKMFQAVIAMLVISIFIGCSDQITSSSDHVTNPGRSGTPKGHESDEVGQIAANYFSTKIKLNPNREYAFSVINTGLSKFTGIDVQKLSPENEDKLPTNCGYVSIYGDKGTKNEIGLSCQSKGFDVKQITIKNLTARILDLNVYLQGVKIKKNPNSEE